MAYSVFSLTRVTACKKSWLSLRGSIQSKCLQCIQKVIACYYTKLEDRKHNSLDKNQIQPQTNTKNKIQMPPKKANFKHGHGHKDKYLATSRKILSQEMLMWNMKALIFII